MWLEEQVCRQADCDLGVGPNGTRYPATYEIRVPSLASGSVAIYGTHACLITHTLSRGTHDGNARQATHDFKER